MLQRLSPAEREALRKQAGVSAPQTIGTPLENPPPAAAPDRSSEQRRDTPASSANKPFGYDIFRSATGNFEAESTVPVPNEYVIGPGDRIQVDLYGNNPQSLTLIVGRDGAVVLPELGPVQVGGMSLETVRALLQSRVESQMIGTRATVSMGALRSIRVFVLGDVEHPGSYLISALATISNALLVAGSADIDAAVKDLVQSAFGHAGQKCSAASLAIVEASVYDNPQFMRQLKDAVTTLKVGPGWDYATVVGPVIRPPEGALKKALSTLEPWESWLVEPKQLDASDRKSTRLNSSHT